MAKVENFKPLLAYTVKDIHKLKYPVLASAKLDGVRCIVIDGVAYSRTLKPIPNKFVQAYFADGASDGLDGELLVGDPTAHDCYNVTYSGVMRIDGEPDFMFMAFDTTPFADTLTRPPFSLRYRLLRETYLQGGLPRRRVRALQHTMLHSANELLDFESTVCELGYEGVMVRDPNGFYKQGRSTARDGILGKIKRFTDAEAVVFGVEELMRNGNAATKNELGYTTRSTAVENLTAGGTLGALVCHTQTGIAFRIGTGFDAATRDKLWAERDSLPGKLVKFKHFEVGAIKAPRFPVFLGFRDPIDV